MIALRLADPCPWPGGYSSHCVESWRPGQVREVPDAEAARLLADYPEAFATVSPPASAGSVPHAAPPEAAASVPLPAPAPAEAAPRTRPRARRGE